jgi:hypothetical protein
MFWRVGLAALLLFFALLYPDGTTADVPPKSVVN